MIDTLSTEIIANAHADLAWLYSYDEIKSVKLMSNNTESLSGENEKPIEGNLRFTIETTDCLHLRFMLKEAGLASQKPILYTSYGLLAELEDSKGNTYVVKEVRNYAHEILI